MNAYVYRSLTAAIDDKKSPLRTHLEKRFPNVRKIQESYRAGSGPLLVNGGEANPGTVGTAFDLMIRFVLDPQYFPDLALVPFRKSWWEFEEPVARVILTARAAASESDFESLACASWVLALCVEVYRINAMSGPLAELMDQGHFAVDELLGLISSDAARQLSALNSVAEERLYPRVLPVRRLDLGPTFDASVVCPADADMIHDGNLMEFKSRLGQRSKQTGLRVDTLTLVDLYQVLGYILFDWSNRYDIRSFGFYSARYGHLAEWSLCEALDVLAGQAVDLAAEREGVQRLLTHK